MADPRSCREVVSAAYAGGATVRLRTVPVSRCLRGIRLGRIDDGHGLAAHAAVQPQGDARGAMGRGPGDVRRHRSALLVENMFKSVQPGGRRLAMPSRTYERKCPSRM